MWLIAVPATVAGVVVAAAVALMYLGFVRPPRNRPTDFLKTGRGSTTTTLVACVGQPAARHGGRAVTSAPGVRAPVA